MQKGIKQNCWQFMKCGREPGGQLEKEQGVCPASIEVRLNGVHHGKSGGRACWVVVGTSCEGAPEGVFVNKHVSCSSCDFYNLVRQEEGNGFLLTTRLLKKMKFG